jgi:DNA-binding CsgD family transcriptional regulator/5-methylcytosine-specific restriction endonuclease McrA
VASVREQVQRLAAKGFSASEIARKIGVASPTVAYHLDRLERRESATKQPITRDPNARSKVATRELVAALLADGFPHAEIARELGLTKSTVAYHARRLQVPVDERCARRYDWQAIQSFYDEGHSVRDCQLRFGFSSQTWNSAVRRGAVRSRPRKLPLSELLVADTFRSRHNLRLRLIGEGVKEAQCERCGLTTWREKPVPLALHHINGDRLDNRLENLELLCMNCHGQTPNFSGRCNAARLAAERALARGELVARSRFPFRRLPVLGEVS